MADLIISFILLAAAIIFILRPPRQINSTYGYRSKRAKKNQRNWDYSQKYCGKLFMWLCGIGFVLQLITSLLNNRAVILLVIYLPGLVLIFGLTEYQLWKRERKDSNE